MKADLRTGGSEEVDMFRTSCAHPSPVSRMRRAVLLAGILGLGPTTVLGFGAGSAEASAAASGTSSQTVLVPGTHPDWAKPTADRGALDPKSTVTSTVTLAGRDKPGMQAYAEAVSTPGTDLYRRFLSPDRFRARFGATAAQIDAVESWLRLSGLRVVSADSHRLVVSGTAAQTATAYGASLHRYAVKGKVYRALSAAAHVPAAIGPDILTIAGLDDMPTSQRPAGPVSAAQAEARITGGKQQMSTGADGAPYIGQTPCSSYYGQLEDTTAPPQAGTSHNPYAICGYVPSQMRSAYGVRGVDGHGVTIAIVDAYGSSTILADADTYAANHGDPAFKPGQLIDTETPAQWIHQDECGGPAGWAPEEHIDVEAAHAMALGATVHYYGANSCENADLLAPLQQIVDTHAADIVSNSWGSVVYSSTGNLDQTDRDSYDQVLMQAAIEGIEMNFSTGDCGAELPSTECGTTDTSTEPQADWPASDPWATAVGGTSTAIGKHGNVLWNTAWATPVYLPPAGGTGPWTPLEWLFGGGGGTSALFDQPWYQRRVVPHGLAATLPTGAATPRPMRTVPDVSMDADPFTGFLIGMTQTLPDGTTGYGESAWGGTSLASPLFAGLQADAVQLRGGRPIGFANPAIYARSGTPLYSDVTGNGPGTKAFNDVPGTAGGTEFSVGFGGTQVLRAARGYDDATGVGAPSPLYLWSFLF